jgi:hypothetical protein
MSRLPPTASPDMALPQISGAVPTSPVELVTHATPLTQVVLVVLVLLSLFSWGIMLAKWLEFRRAASSARPVKHH